MLLKLILGKLGPVSILAYRYSFAALLLIPILYRRQKPTNRSILQWRDFLILALTLYVVGNGAFLLALRDLSATTASLLLNLLPVLVMIGSAALLGETATTLQSVGLLVVVSGAVLYFAPAANEGSPIALVMMILALIGNAGYGLYARRLQRSGRADTLAMTAIPLGIAASVLVPIALIAEGTPRTTLRVWGILIALAAFNTATVFLLINHGLKRLAAYQMAALINVAPFITAFWAWLLTGDRLTEGQIMGMLVLVAGTALVQVGGHRNGTV